VSFLLGKFTRTNSSSYVITGSSQEDENVHDGAVLITEISASLSILIVMMVLLVAVVDFEDLSWRGSSFRLYMYFLQKKYVRRVRARVVRENRRFSLFLFPRVHFVLDERTSRRCVLSPPPRKFRKKDGRKVPRNG